jgi:hypothetical protein
LVPGLVGYPNGIGDTVEGERLGEEGDPGYRPVNSGWPDTKGGDPPPPILRPIYALRSVALRHNDLAMIRPAMVAPPGASVCVSACATTPRYRPPQEPVPRRTRTQRPAALRHHVQSADPEP